MSGTRNGRKLGRITSHRKALYRNMACSLIKYEEIKTTTAKAKSIKGFIDKIISTAKKNDLNSKRKISENIKDKEVYNKIFTVLVPRFSERKSGFARIIKLNNRISDNAPMSILKLIS
ncbi:50S ribosomal protein L17 [bacterium]